MMISRIAVNHIPTQFVISLSLSLTNSHFYMFPIAYKNSKIKLTFQYNDRLRISSADHNHSQFEMLPLSHDDNENDDEINA